MAPVRAVNPAQIATNLYVSVLGNGDALRVRDKSDGIHTKEGLYLSNDTRDQK